MLPLLLAATALTAPQDDPPAEGASFWSVDAGFFDHPHRDERQIAIGSARVGLGYFFRDDFALIGQLDGFVVDGDPDHDAMLPDADTRGVGAAAMVRWYALRRPGWDLFVDYGVGLALTEDSFPPGGTSLNGTHQAAVGVAVPISETYRFTVAARHQHLSNGQGFTADNPAWDGLGLFVGFSIARPGTRAVAARGPFEAIDPEPFSLRLEGGLGQSDGDSYAGGRALIDGRLEGDWFGQVSLGASEVRHRDRTHLGLALYHRGDDLRRGLLLDHDEGRRRDATDLGGFFEYDANDLITVAGSLGLESRRGSDRVFGGLVFRYYPTHDLMLESGFGARSRWERLDAGSVSLMASIEYAPRTLASRGFSLFADRGYDDDTEQVGIRWRLGDWSGSLRDRHLSSGVRISKP